MDPIPNFKYGSGSTDLIESGFAALITSLFAAVVMLECGVGGEGAFGWVFCFLFIYVKVGR